MYIHSGTRCIGEKTVQYWPKIYAVPGTCECVFLIYDVNLQPRNKKEEEKEGRKSRVTLPRLSFSISLSLSPNDNLAPSHTGEMPLVSSLPWSWV